MILKHFSKNKKRDIHAGMSGDDSGYEGTWGTHQGVSQSKTIILSGHLFFEKFAIFNFLSIFEVPKNRFF